MKRILFTYVFILFLCKGSYAFGASTTLIFETQGFDLDSETVVEIVPNQIFVTGNIDFLIAYNADTTPHAVLNMALEGVEMIRLDGVAYDNVTYDSINGLPFTDNDIDQPLEQNDTVVLRTDTGMIYKIGNAIETESSITISYEPLQ